VQRAVFLDKNGTITEDGDRHVKVAPPRLIPGAAEALRRLQDAGYLLFVVTNQSGVARGYFTEQDVQTYNDRMTALLAQAGVHFQEISCCPHMPDGGCACRKPGTRFLADAAERYDIDLSRSFVVGDQTTDVEMGARNGCRTFLVRTGHGGRDGSAQTPPDLIVADIVEAVNQILRLDAEDA